MRLKNFFLTGSAGKPILLDSVIPAGFDPYPMALHLHGFCGFKDWAGMDLIAEAFAARGIGLVKFNFSHNGTSPAQPEVFADLEAFGNNNYSRQLEDIRLVMEALLQENQELVGPGFSGKIHLIGHSMGGGMALLYATRDRRIVSVSSWAGIHQCTTPWGNWPEAKMREWKERGVAYYVNSRTGQHLPLYYQLHEDYLDHREELDIEAAVRSLDIHVLLCHGTSDTVVPVQAAYSLKKQQPAAELFILETDHVFGRVHPLPGNEIPDAMMQVVDRTADFILRHP